MKRVIWLLVGLLIVLHQDYWQWGDTSLCFGFLPYTLAYHAALSLLAAAVWCLAAFCFWPHQLEVEALGQTADEAALTDRASTGRAATARDEMGGTAAGNSESAGANGP